MAHSIKKKVSDLYEGESKRAYRFRFALLGIDIAIIIFLVVSTFFDQASFLEAPNLVFGVYVAADYLVRLWIAPRRWNFLIHPLNVVDVVVFISFLTPLLGVSLAFLRALRILRLLRSYPLQHKLCQHSAYFKKHQDIILSATNLFIFIFLMSELVFVTQVHSNPKVSNFIDAMYFTIATLTTTGFGDVTLEGQSGRIISIVVMIFGVSLFLRLIQTMFRPSKVRFVCEDCGLFLHESDAVHCKHCGNVLNIPSDGDV